jgi:hypothetical protein
MARIPGYLRADSASLYTNLTVLIAANILTIYLYKAQHSSVWQILITYYIQTILIAFFYYRRILTSVVTTIDSETGPIDTPEEAYEVQQNTVRDQFLYVLLFGAPLGFLLFVMVFNLSGTMLFDAVPLQLSDINLWSITLVSLLFLLHHIFSYGISVWEYRSGRIPAVTIPYARLCVRVFTIFGLVFLIPIIFVHGGSQLLFYTFVGVKTILDVMLSTTFSVFGRGSTTA